MRLPVSPEILIVSIAAGPPTLAALLGYFANSRSLRRTVGAPEGMPLARVVERLDAKIDGLTEGQSEMRERLARLEGAPELRFWRPS